MKTFALITLIAAGWFVIGFLAALIDKYFEGPDEEVLALSVLFGQLSMIISLFVAIKHILIDLYDRF